MVVAEWRGHDIFNGMNPGTKTLLERVQAWPEEDQEELADVAREIESRRSGVYRLSDEERTAVRAGMNAARRGDFVPDEEMDEFYRLHRSV
jgi:predicted transcriptional regulator